MKELLGLIRKTLFQAHLIQMNLTPLYFEEYPCMFNLQAAGNVSGKDLYNKTTLNYLSENDSVLDISLFNSGISEVTIPQLIITYYNDNKEMIWVDQMFVQNSVRQQRQQHFTYKLKRNFDLEIINESMENCYVNGLPNVSISDKIIPYRRVNDTHKFLQPVSGDKCKYIKVEINSYLGSVN